MGEEALRLVLAINLEFPLVVIAGRSEVWWARGLDAVARLFGADLSMYATAIGMTVAVPDSFDSWPAFNRYRLLRHEREHLRQYRRWGLGCWPLGTVVVALLYLLVLPLGLTMRAYFEAQAFRAEAEACQVAALLCGASPAGATYDWFEREVLHAFTTRQYLWMLPFPRIVRCWARRTWTAATPAPRTST